MIFEDDVMISPLLRNFFEAGSLPFDWEVIFLGCTHVKTPEVVAPGWVRIRKVWGTHAYAVHQRYYKALLKAMSRPISEGEEAGVDNVISRLSDEIPMYAAYPNLAWQSEGYSDIMETFRQTYDEHGRQTRFPAVIRKIDAAMAKLIHSQDDQSDVER